MNSKYMYEVVKESEQANNPESISEKEIDTILKIEAVLIASGLNFEFMRLPPDEQTQNDPHWTYVIEFNHEKEMAE